MSYIKTWVERCDEHPDHQSGMVSNGMIQARMQEEIADLRAEIERLRADNERLRPAEMSPAEKMKILDDLRAQETRRRAALEGKP